VEYPQDGVALVSITSEPLGLLRFEVKRELGAVFAKLETEHRIRCLVLTGTGRAFSVGSDIKDFRQDIGWLLENEYGGCIGFSL